MNARLILIVTACVALFSSACGSGPQNLKLQKKSAIVSISLHPVRRQSRAKFTLVESGRKPAPDSNKEITTMRFMMLMIPKGYDKAAPDVMPDAKAVAAMMKYNESLQKAG